MIVRTSTKAVTFSKILHQNETHWTRYKDLIPYLKYFFPYCWSLVFLSLYNHFYQVSFSIIAKCDVKVLVQVLDRLILTDSYLFYDQIIQTFAYTHNGNKRDSCKILRHFFINQLFQTDNSVDSRHLKNGKKIRWL